METNREISEEVLKYFKGIIGMKEAQTIFQLLLDTWNFQSIRNGKGYTEAIINNFNFLICGERGTGKTLLSEILSSFIQNSIAGMKYTVVRYNSRLISEKESTIMAQIKETAMQKDNSIIILENIDELLNDEDVSYSVRKNVIMTITDIMKNNDINVVLIITGSNKGIASMISLDPRIESYVFDTIHIDNYSPDELWKMMQNMAEKEQLHIDEECGPLIRERLQTQMFVDGFLNGTIVEKYKKEAAKQLASNYFSTNKVATDENLAKIDINAISFMGSSGQLQSYVNKLNNLIGLEKVKKIVTNQLIMMKVSQKNDELGINDKNNQTLHMVFQGDPGTGKTTVADILGNIYCEMGVLPNGNQGVKTVSRADLVGQYVGETAQRVRHICEEADGGVLFIDEAYSLVNSSDDSFGKEAVDTLIQEMENRRNSIMVILAGYTNEMKVFLEVNQGLRSRIPSQNYVSFDNYTPDELLLIFKSILKNDGYRIDPLSVSDDTLKAFLNTQSKTPGFGNARGVRNVVQRVEEIVRIRVYENEVASENDSKIRRLTKLERTLVRNEDILKLSEGILKDNESIELLLEKLSNLVGLKGVKEQVRDIIRAVEYSNLLKERGIAMNRFSPTMHLVFSGNPGTGKSTIAELLGKIYRNLGVLKKNSFVVAKRENLVGQYQGHTASRVAAKVAEADGGILFIDEAYQLCLDEHDTFGMEAIGTLLSLVEEKRDSLMVILAGYEEDMNRFISLNPGLRSRFPKTILFDDYEIDELMLIFKYMMEKERKMNIAEGVCERVEKIISAKKVKDPREFGNARGVRNIVDNIIIRQNSRIACDKENIYSYSDEDLFTVIEEDVVDE